MTSLMTDARHFLAEEHHRPLAFTKLYWLVTKAHGLEQLFQSRYVAES